MRIRFNNNNGQRKLSLANFSGFGYLQPGSITVQGNQFGGQSSISSLFSADLRSGFLEGILQDCSEKEMQAIYRDMYYHDHTAGAVVDLRANMPWSDFTLIGGTDDKLQPFYDAIDRLNLRSLHSEISVDNMVTGAFVATIIYDTDENTFTCLMPMDYGDCTVVKIPIYTESPILHWTVPPHIQSFAMMQGSVEVDRVKKMLPDSMLRKFREGGVVELDPFATLYLPRTSMSHVHEGLSFFHRIVPIYVLERVLFRGTITEATKRQRSTLHITAGNEDWMPTQNELSNLIGAFQATEQDPISAVVATRDNVQTNEIRAAGDFWKWTEEVSNLRDMKMQGLGVSDSFLSGEATFNNIETALTVFIETIRAERELFTERLYKSKLFPLVASINDLLEEDAEPAENATPAETAAWKRRRYVHTASQSPGNITRLIELHMQMDDTESLLIPEVYWHKPLRPEADREYVEMLETMKEQGIPIPIRMMAAAGGIALDQIMRDLPEDEKIREKLKEFTGGEEDDEYGFASTGGKLRKGALSNIKNRPYPEEVYEVHGRTKTGRRKYIHDQNGAQQKMHEKAAKALYDLSDENTYEEARKRAKRRRTDL